MDCRSGGWQHAGQLSCGRTVPVLEPRPIRCWHRVRIAPSGCAESNETMWGRAGVEATWRPYYPVNKRGKADGHPPVPTSSRSGGLLLVRVPLQVPDDPNLTLAEFIQHANNYPEHHQLKSQEDRHSGAQQVEPQSLDGPAP